MVLLLDFWTGTYTGLLSDTGQRFLESNGLCVDSPVFGGQDCLRSRLDFPLCAVFAERNFTLRLSVPTLAFPKVR